MNSGLSLIMGWLTFTNDPVPTLEGSVYWGRPNVPGNAFYPAGFTNTLAIVGSLYTPPAPATRILDMTNGTLTIMDGDLPANLVYTVALLTNNVVTNLTGLPTNKFSVKFTNSTGAMTVTFRPTGAATDKTVHGTVSQQSTNAAGWFQGTTHTGSILLQP